MDFLFKLEGPELRVLPLELGTVHFWNMVSYLSQVNIPYNREIRNIKDWIRCYDNGFLSYKARRYLLSSYMNDLSDDNFPLLGLWQRRLVNLYQLKQIQLDIIQRRLLAQGVINYQLILEARDMVLSFHPGLKIDKYNYNGISFTYINLFEIEPRVKKKIEGFIFLFNLQCRGLNYFLPLSFQERVLESYEGNEIADGMINNILPHYLNRYDKTTIVEIILNSVLNRIKNRLTKQEIEMVKREPLFLKNCIIRASIKDGLNLDTVTQLIKLRRKY